MGTMEARQTTHERKMKMNMTEKLIKRAEKAFTGKCFPCNTYFTKEVCEKETAKAAQAVATHLDVNKRQDARPANFKVVYVESWGRWVGFIDMTEALFRPNCARNGNLDIEPKFLKF